EVVGYHDETLYLMPQGDITGLPTRARVRLADSVIPTSVQLPENAHPPATRAPDRSQALPVGWKMLGRVVDASGRPLDSLGDLDDVAATSLGAETINPLARAPIDSTLDVGVRAINGLLTVGQGQRMGLFAGSGVGKSVLLGMMAR